MVNRHSGCGVSFQLATTHGWQAGSLPPPFELNKSLGEMGEQGSCRAYDAKVRQEPHPPKQGMEWAKSRKTCLEGLPDPPEQ